eukprot:3686842-Lingulodinium_polyedra.AAC.1
MAERLCARFGVFSAAAVHDGAALRRSAPSAAVERASQEKPRALGLPNLKLIPKAWEHDLAEVL